MLGSNPEVNHMLNRCGELTSPGKGDGVPATNVDALADEVRKKSKETASREPL